MTRYLCLPASTSVGVSKMTLSEVKEVAVKYKFGEHQKTETGPTIDISAADETTQMLRCVFNFEP